MKNNINATFSNFSYAQRVRDWLKKNSGILLLLLVEIIFLSITAGGTFLSQINIMNVIRQTSITLYIGIAATFVMIIGGIDLSIGSIMAISAIGAVMMADMGYPFLLCLTIALLIGTVIGVLNGVLTSYTDLPPFIVTYAVSTIFRGLTYIVSNGQAIRITNKSFLAMGSASIGIVPLPIIYLIIIILISWYILNQTKLGRQMFVVGGNAKAAEFSGINIKKVKIFAYGFVGLMSALAGIVTASRSVSGQPTLGQGAEMDAVAAVVLGGTSMAGGKGSIGGTVIGAMIIALINNGLNLLGVNGYWQYVAKGLVIIVAVYIDLANAKRMQRAKKGV